MAHHGRNAKPLDDRVAHVKGKGDGGAHLVHVVGRVEVSVALDGHTCYRT